MAGPIERVTAIRDRWRADPWRPALLVAGVLLAAFIAQGLPYWDADFTINFPSVLHKSTGRLLAEWIAPISANPENWGFLDRHAQFLAYKLSYQIAGYDPWPYSLLRTFCYAGMAVMIYLWIGRLTGASKHRWPAGLAAIFFLVAPGPVAAHVWLADFAPVSEFLFLVLTWLLWREIEATPDDWRSLFPIDAGKRRWLLAWLILVLATYLCYKTKPDLKLVPAILGLYILLVRPRQWRVFAVPLAVMVLLAVPWSTSGSVMSIPFMPGSTGGSASWMWQPASLARLTEFIWSSAPYDFSASLSSSSLSLAGALGPFFLTALGILAAWHVSQGRRVPMPGRATAEDRARIFVLLWFAVILAGASVLPPISYFFRIRYAILPLVPVCILLGWLLSFLDARRDRTPRWAVVGLVAALVVQSGVNLNRSIAYRRTLGQTMIAVDDAYGRIDADFRGDAIALMPGFLGYAYREGASEAFQRMDALARPEDLALRHLPNRTSVLGWNASLWEQLDLTAVYSGSHPTILFDRLFPPAAGTGVFLMRYIGPDPGFSAAEAARAKGDLVAARQGYEEFVARHPNSPAGLFWLGFANYYLKDWPAAERANRQLEEWLPDHPSVIYNRATTLMELGQYDAAIPRLERLTTLNPRNYGAQLNLYSCYRKAGDTAKAAARLQVLRELFPTDPEVRRLVENPG